MGFLSFVGRVLFASIFLISAYQEGAEFGSDGGPAAKFLEPKFNLFVKQVSTNTGMAVPRVDIKTVVLATMYIRAFGGLMFILYSSVGAFLLVENENPQMDRTLGTTRRPQMDRTPVANGGPHIEQIPATNSCIPCIHNPYCVRLLQLRNGVTAVCSALHPVLTEPGPLRCVVLLHGDEKLHPEEVQKDAKDQDNLTEVKKHLSLGLEAINTR